MIKQIQNKSDEVKIAVIGGDRRQLAAAESFASHGASVLAWGFDRCGELPRGVAASASAQTAVMEADAVLLPIPCMADDRLLNAPLAAHPVSMRELISCAQGGIWFAGRVGGEYTDMAAERGIRLVDYSLREEFGVRNAVPTAEGAVGIAMGELPVTIHGARSLVIGYGRIGRVLSRMLQGLGSSVTVAARREEHRAWISCDGNIPIKPSDMARYAADSDVIFNTVPQVLLDAELLSHVGENTPIIDLASKPGGVDIEVAKLQNKRVIWALSLPAKVAPITSGRIIFDCVSSILRDEEGWRI